MSSKASHIEFHNFSHSYGVRSKYHIWCFKYGACGCMCICGPMITPYFGCMQSFDHTDLPLCGYYMHSYRIRTKKVVYLALCSNICSQLSYEPRWMKQIQAIIRFKMGLIWVLIMVSCFNISKSKLLVVIVINIAIFYKKWLLSIFLFLIMFNMHYLFVNN